MRWKDTKKKTNKWNDDKHVAIHKFQRFNTYSIKFRIRSLNSLFNEKYRFLCLPYYCTPLCCYQRKARYMHERTISCRMFALGRPRRIVTQGLYCYPGRNSPLLLVSGSGLMVFIVHQDRRISVRCEHGNIGKRPSRHTEAPLTILCIRDSRMKEIERRVMPR